MSTEQNQDQPKVDHDYTSGFNSGYLIAKYEPELSDKLVISLQKEAKLRELNPYANGITHGILELEIEKSKEQFKGITKVTPSSSEKPRSPDKGHTK